MDYFTSTYIAFPFPILIPTSDTGPTGVMMWCHLLGKASTIPFKQSEKQEQSRHKMSRATDSTYIRLAQRLNLALSMINFFDSY